MSELDKQSGVLQYSISTSRTNSNFAASSDGGGARASTTCENMTLQEFAKLMLIFRDVPEAAADPNRSGQDLTREQLHPHTNRNAFWDNRIYPLFHDPQHVSWEEFDTVIYKNLSVSGNLEPSGFVSFCYLSEMNALSKAGKRCLVALRTFRLGTPHQNTFILDFVTEEMAVGSRSTEIWTCS